MQGEECFHQKFGFCKFKEMCRKQHLEETCKELSACLKPNNCPKRHPKECKRYEKGLCRFGISCAYSHQEKSTIKAGNKDINAKVEMLEKMVFEMAEKIMKLESKVKENESKDTSTTVEASKKIETIENVNNEKEKTKDLKEKKTKEKVSVFKFGAEARNTVSFEIKSKLKDKSAKEFKCELCDYSSEKLTTLKKHRNSKHTEQQCKVCRKEFKSAMDLIIHVSNVHQEQEG